MAAAKIMRSVNIGSLNSGARRINGSNMA